MEPNFSEHITVMLNSDSPVAIAAGMLLNDFMKVGVGLNSFVIPSLEDLYTDGKGSGRLSVRAGKEVGRVSLVITQQRKYYLIYFPTASEEGDLLKIYESYEIHSPRFEPDTRSITLEINLNSTSVVAKPVVMLTDAEQPMTRGRISHVHFVSVYPDLLSKMVDRMKEALAGEMLIADGKEFTRTKRNFDIVGQTF
jgi:hypothetical protein